MPDFPDHKSYHLKKRWPDTVVELVDPYFPDGCNIPMKPQIVLINGQPVCLERDGIDVQLGVDDDCTRVTIRLFATRLEVRGYRDTDLPWLEESSIPSTVVTKTKAKKK